MRDRELVRGGARSVRHRGHATPRRRTGALRGPTDARSLRHGRGAAVLPANMPARGGDVSLPLRRRESFLVTRLVWRRAARQPRVLLGHARTQPDAFDARSLTSIGCGARVPGAHGRLPRADPPSPLPRRLRRLPLPCRAAGAFSLNFNRKPKTKKGQFVSVVQ